jgi:hypothetical protein
MLVLLVTAEGGDDLGSTAGHGDAPRPRAAAGSAALAAAWRAAAPDCVVEQLVVPGGPAAAPVGPPPSTTSGARPVVLVPTTALGLRSAVVAPTSPHLARLAERVESAELVVVHVEVLDTAALHAGPVADAAGAAAPHAVPVVVLAGSDRTTRRALAAAGVAGVHEVGDPWDTARLGRVARTWCPPRRPGVTQVIDG